MLHGSSGETRGASTDVVVEGNSLSCQANASLAGAVDVNCSHCAVRRDVIARPLVDQRLAGKTDDTRVEEKSNEAACDGYLVSGAGNAAANGCYKSRHSVCGREGFALTDAMTLYDWKGTWRLPLSL